MQIGRLYSRIGAHEKAKEYFEPYFPIDQTDEIRSELFRVLYAYTLKNLERPKDSERYVEHILQKRSKFMQPESSYFTYNFQALAAAHALRGNVDSTIYWMEKWKDTNGNFDLILFKTDPIYQSIIKEPIVQKFIQDEQMKIDSMAANIRQMMIKG